LAGWASLVGTNALWVVKLDSSYNITWKKQYNPSTTTPKELRSQNIKIDGSGNIYIVGLAYSTGANNNENFICKINSSGTMQWIKRIYSSTYSTNTSVATYALDVDSSGNVYFGGGWPYGSNPGNNAFAVIKMNTSGTIQWQKHLSTAGSGNGTTYAIKVSSDGSNIYVSGNYWVSGRDEEAAVFKMATSDGTCSWSRILNSTSYESHDGMQIAEDSSGNIYLKGRTQTPSWLITKYNSSGTLQWQRQITPLSIGGLGGVAVSSDGLSLYVSSGNNYIAKLPTDGSGMGTFTLSGQSITYGAGTRTDSSGSTTFNNSSWTATDISYTASDITGSIATTTANEQITGMG
jgi:hypothetical protein